MDITDSILPTSPLQHLDLISVMTPSPTEDPLRFVGLANPYGAIGIYGGHFLGQALAAGLATVAEPKLAHSFHSYFLKRGNPDVPIEYEVGVLRNGRGSDVRSIAAVQDGAEVFHMIASFKAPEDGPKHQKPMPEVVSADELIEAREARGDDPFPFPPTQNGWSQMEWATPTFRDYEPDRDPELRVWMRVPADRSLTPRERQVVLAFLCDGPIVFNSVLPYGVPMDTHWTTSLDHSAWFHDPADPSDWLLFDQRSTAAADGRGMNEGEIYGADGALVMTCAQESLFRLLPTGP